MSKIVNGAIAALAGTVCFISTLAVVGAQGPFGEPSTARTFVGRVSGSENEFVGITVDGAFATVYICDGRVDVGTVTISEWFVGPMTDDRIEITNSAGLRVEAIVGDVTVEGTVTPPSGGARSFSLGRAEGFHGLLRSEFQIDGARYVSGWVVLADGSVRGAAATPRGHVVVTLPAPPPSPTPAPGTR